MINITINTASVEIDINGKKDIIYAGQLVDIVRIDDDNFEININRGDTAIKPCSILIHYDDVTAITGITTMDALITAISDVLSAGTLSRPTLLINDTVAVTGLSAEGFQVESDTVFASLLATDGTNLLVQKRLVTTAGTFKAGFFHKPKGYRIGTVTLTSGSIIVIL